MKKVQEVEWISEADAAASLGFSPLYLRRAVREGKILGINYTKLNYRTYQYNKADIDNYKMVNSTIPQGT